MLIQYMSDLHLEFGNNSVYLKSRLKAAGDILLICGDVGYIGDEQFNRPIANRIADFKKIQCAGVPLTTDRYNIEHKKCQEFLMKSIDESKADNIIVASHHVPSTNLIPDDFHEGKYIAAFASDTAPYINDRRVKYWIYGHSHRNINKSIGHIQYLTNQLGYVRYNEHSLFQVDSVVEAP